VSGAGGSGVEVGSKGNRVQSDQLRCRDWRGMETIGMNAPYIKRTHKK
jgi:hypothetical protein